LVRGDWLGNRVSYHPRFLPELEDEEVNENRNILVPIGSSACYEQLHKFGPEYRISNLVYQLAIENKEENFFEKYKLVDGVR